MLTTNGPPRPRLLDLQGDDTVDLLIAYGSHRTDLPQGDLSGIFVTGPERLRASVLLSFLNRGLGTNRS